MESFVELPNKPSPGPGVAGLDTWLGEPMADNEGAGESDDSCLINGASVFLFELFRAREHSGHVSSPSRNAVVSLESPQQNSQRASSRLET